MTDRIKFLPLLLIYIFIVLIFSTYSFQYDEGRYVWYATYISMGKYPPLIEPQMEISLWNGPGYPLVLAPFVIWGKAQEVDFALKLPWISAKLLNALFLFMAVLYFYSTLRFYMKERTASIFSYIFGIYPLFFRFVHFMLTEVLAIFLVCGFLFHFCKFHRENRTSYAQLIISSVYLGYLALTKVIFGYVILAGLLMFLFLYIWRKRGTFKRTLLVYSFALLFCMPYLVFTYSLTGKIYYWGSAGGLALYSMSTPYENEFGDWIHIFSSGGPGNKEWMRINPKSVKNHQEIIRRLEKLSGIQRDDELKKQAIYNIIQYPTKYFKNWMANIGRLVFNYPYTNTPQKLSTYFYIIPNMFLVVLCVLSLYPCYLRRRLIPYEIFAMVVFGLITFGGHSLLASYGRQFIPIVPILAFWISYTFTQIVKVDIRQ